MTTLAAPPPVDVMTKGILPPVDTQASPRWKVVLIVLLVTAIALHLAFWFSPLPPWTIQFPLIVAIVAAGIPVLWQLMRRLVRGQFGSDMLAGISIITAVILGQYLAGAIVVLMLAGGELLESYALRTASGALRALVRRMPTIAHCWQKGMVVDVAASDLRPDDNVLLLPHEICPADGVVTEGRGSMDESFLTGEPYGIAKAPGSEVLSGALNGEAAITLRVLRAPSESRYVHIVKVMGEAEQSRMRLRRLGDTLGAWMTPLVLVIAVAAWLISGEVLRFLAVLVAATPCPLIIAIPVAVIGSISLCARHGIVIRDAGILEHLETCRTVIFDKTGTLTVGRPVLSEVLAAPGRDTDEVLQLAASVEQYSRHPLAWAVLQSASERSLRLLAVDDVHEPPGFGLRARVAGHMVTLTGRKHLDPAALALLPPLAGGLECIVLLDGHYAATLRFRDEPRADLRRFIGHLGPHHGVRKTILLTGDRRMEAERIASVAGIQTVNAEKSPEEKLAIVRAETAKAPTLFVGDGVNDAPALMAATVGVALGAGTDVAAAAAGAVILEPSLRKLDVLAHIARRLRTIVLQSAIGGLALSFIAIAFAATGHLTPVYGALLQECIDLLAILNAMRAAFPPVRIADL